MAANHRVLVVEDDTPTGEEIAEILRADGFESVVHDNAHDALIEIEGRSVCAVVMDLDIKADKDALKGHTEYGLSLVRGIRKVFPAAGLSSHWLPVIVVSGRAAAADPAVELMKSGANDVVQKPVTGQKIRTALASALVAAGISSHSECAKMVAKAANAAGDILISIPGGVSGRRTRVVVGGYDVDLPDTSLKVFLHLVVAHLKGKRVHKSELGATKDDPAFKGVSRLRTDIGLPIVKSLNLFRNDQRGSYWMSERVTIGECATTRLKQLKDSEITALADEIEGLRRI